MLKILKIESNRLQNEIKKLELKAVVIFLSSIILLLVSWYFSNPNYLNEIFTFHQSFDIIIEDLISFGYWFLSDFILFFCVPFVIIKFIFQENLKTYGITFGDWQIGLGFFFFSILLFIPVIYFISVADQFNSYFPLMLSAKNDLVVFLIYETLFILFIFSWEFIFRGFMLFGLEKKFGFYSIFIQMLPFVLLHSGKPFIETFSSIFGGIILGYLALRTRSIYYGFLIHVLILITLDVIALFK